MAIKKQHLISAELADWQTPVEDKDLTTSPESPSNGDKYIIAGTGGDWSAGTINDIVWYIDDEWYFITPTEGMQVYIKDENVYYFFNGSVWGTISGGSGDMLKSTYDTNTNNIVDKAEAIDDGNGNTASASEIVKSFYNIVVLAFRLAYESSLAIFNMVDGFVDEYEDESGIDTVNSINESYDSSNDLYKPSGGGTGIDSYTKLMLHCNGTDGSTSFPDDSDSSHTVTANGDAQVDTADKKFGSGSALFDGTGDYLSVPDSDDFDFSGDFTIDLWVKHDATASERGIIGSLGAGDDGWLLFLSSSGAIRFISSDGSTSLTGSQVDDDTWHHIAIVRYGSDANNLKIYLDGTLDTQGTNTSTLTANGTLTIGREYNDSDNYYFDGWMDEIRISNGIARWTSNFTPLTEEYSSTVYDNMTLISEAVVAISSPNNARIVILEEDIDEITLNTDLKAYVSNDDGDNWHQGTLAEEGDYDTSTRILIATVDISAQEDTDMIYKLVTDNNKGLKVHGTALTWD